MIASRVRPIDEPRQFEPHELFFSLTDEKGRIRSGNQVFTRISGYDEAELIGQPHNIIRHPDMPRCVFKLLWDYLEAGKSIAAYVKNLAKDGRYYWVLATVVPCRGGFLSVRLKPSTGLFDAAQAIYAETLAYEQKVEEDRGKKAAMAESTNFLLEQLAAAGFSNYDEFMQAALSQELVSRDAEIRENPINHPVRSSSGSKLEMHEMYRRLEQVVSRLGRVFASLGLFQQVSEKLTTKHHAMEELGPSLSFLALNCNVSASRLGEEGAVLNVISRSLGDSSKKSDQLIGTLVDRMGPLCQDANALAFDVAVAQLEAQVCEAFALELLAADASQDEGHVRESLDVLTEEMDRCCRSVFHRMNNLEDHVRVLGRAAKDLGSEVEHMRIAQINGKIEIANCSGADSFQSIFNDVAVIVEEARSDCKEISEVLEKTGVVVESLLKSESALDEDLTQVRQIAEGKARRKLQANGSQIVAMA